MFDCLEYLKEINEFEEELSKRDEDVDYEEGKIAIDKKYKIIYKKAAGGGLDGHTSYTIILDQPMNNYYEFSYTCKCFGEDPIEFNRKLLESGNERIMIKTIPEEKIRRLKELISDLPQSIVDYELPNTMPALDLPGTQFNFYDYENDRVIQLYNNGDFHLSWIYNIEAFFEQEGMEYYSDGMYKYKGKTYEWFVEHSIAISEPLRYVHIIEEFFSE